MKQYRPECERLALFLSRRLGGDGLERKRKGDDWHNVRARLGTDTTSFIDFCFGGGEDHALFATHLNGPLRSTSEGDAFAYFKIRINEEGKARLEVHTMAADWHRKKAADPANINARIRLAHRIARIAPSDLPSQWKLGVEKKIADPSLRSATVWLWRDWLPMNTLEALANRVTDDVCQFRPLLIEAARKD
jgi:hypothetical protein